jgi:hypothetical protein
VVQAGLGIKRDPISKITSAMRAGGVTQVGEHLPSNLAKCGALSSNPSTTKKEGRKGRREGGRKKGRKEGRDGGDF